MADGQQVNVVGGAVNSLSEQGNFAAIVDNQLEKTTGDETTDIVSMAFADIDETPAYLQTVSDESNLATVENVTLQATPVAETDASPAAENVTSVQEGETPQTVASTDAVDVHSLGNGSDSAAVSMPASMLLGSIANLIDNSAAVGTTSTTMTINELQNNPSLMNILNSAEVQAAIQNNQHITIVQVPDRSIIGELNGEKTITSVQTTNIHANMPPLGPITTHRYTAPKRKITTVTTTAIPATTTTTIAQLNTNSTIAATTVMTPTKLTSKSEKANNQNKVSKSDEKKKPHRAVTRSGRVSKPPSYRVRDYKTLRTGALTISSDTEDDYSDYTPDDDEEDDADRSENFKYPFGSERPKKFKCTKCEKSYIGRAGLARHFKLNPTHGKEEDIPEPPPPPKISDGDRPTPRRPGRPPRIQSTSSTIANIKPLTGQPVPITTAKSMSTTTTSTSTNSTIKGVSILNQTEMPSDVKVVYPPQSLAKRKQRIRELLKTIGDEDVLELVLPRLSKLVTVWEFLLMKVERGRPSRPHFPDVYKELGKVVTEIKKMAEECLEPINKEDHENMEEIEAIKLYPQTIDIDDEAIANVLGIKTGHFNVKESPLPEYEFKYKLLVTDPSDVERIPKERRIIEVVSQDELVDPSNSKRRKLEHIEQCTSPRKIDVIPSSQNHQVQEVSPISSVVSQPNSTSVPSMSQQSQKMPALSRIVTRPTPIAPKPDTPLLTSSKADSQILHTSIPKVDSTELNNPKVDANLVTIATSIAQLQTTTGINNQLLQPTTPRSDNQLLQRTPSSDNQLLQTTQTSENQRLQTNLSSDNQLLQTNLSSENQLLQTTQSSENQLLQTTQSSENHLLNTLKPNTPLPNTPKQSTSPVTQNEPKTVESSTEGTMQAACTSTITERQILTLPPGYIMSKTVDGYTIEKPDGSSIHITGTGDGGIPLETIQALLSIEPSLFQTETTNTEHSMAVTNDAQTVTKEVCENSVIPAADSTSVAMDTNDETHTMLVTTEEPVFVHETELREQEVSQQSVLPAENMDSTTQFVTQETVAMTASVCSENSAINVSGGQILTNGNTVSSSQGLDNVIVNNVA